MDAVYRGKCNSHISEGDGRFYSPSPSPAEDANVTRASAAKKPKATTEIKVSKNQADTETCSLSKREFGDEIEAALRVEKYEDQRMRINVLCCL